MLYGTGQMFEGLRVSYSAVGRHGVRETAKLPVGRCCLLLSLGVGGLSRGVYDGTTIAALL